MKKKSKKIGLSIFITASIALLMIGLLVIKTRQLGKEADKLQEEYELTNQKIETAKRERTNIENEIKYRETDDYIKEEAKNIFGLRDPDDTIFLPSDGEEEGTSEDKTPEQ